MIVKVFFKKFYDWLNFDFILKILGRNVFAGRFSITFCIRETHDNSLVS